MSRATSVCARRTTVSSVVMSLAESAFASSSWLFNSNITFEDHSGYAIANT